MKSENEVLKASLGFEKETQGKVEGRVGAFLSKNELIQKLPAAAETWAKQFQERLEKLLDRTGDIPFSNSAQHIHKMVGCEDPKMWMKTIGVMTVI